MSGLINIEVYQVNIKARLEKLEGRNNPEVMEITIIRFSHDLPLPEPALIGNTKVSYQYADKEMI